MQLADYIEEVLSGVHADLEQEIVFRALLILQIRGEHAAEYAKCFVQVVTDPEYKRASEGLTMTPGWLYAEYGGFDVGLMQSRD